MSIFDYFRKPTNKNTAAVAKERLQIIIAHQRARQVDYLHLLQKDLIEVIGKYVEIDEDQVKVALEHSNEGSVLELNISLPGANAASGTGTIAAGSR